MLTRDRLGAFVAVLFGTAAVALTLTLLGSAHPRVPDRYAAVAVAVQSPRVTTPADPFPEPRPWSSAEATALAARLAAAPGVAAAIPDRRFYAQPVLNGRPSPAVQEGHGWASTALAADTLVAGRPPTGEREVVLSRGSGVPVGGSVPMLTATGPSWWRVTGLVDADRLYVSDATAARMAPGVRVIGLTGSPRLPQVRALAGGATVLHGSALGELEPRSDARTRWIGLQVITAMTALSAFACAFVIASTFALTVHQRRREIGLLRATGATPAQVRRSVIREAALVGIVAGTAGTLLGVVLSPLIGRVLVDAGFEPRSFAVGFHLWAVLAGVAAGPLLAVAGSLTAAHRAARVGPLEALRQAQVEPRPMTRLRWITGLLFTAGGMAAGLATTVTDDVSDLATFALLGAMALVVGATVLAPAAVPLLVRVLLRPARGPIATVMRESALAGAQRTASTAAPVLLTVAFAVFIAGNVQTSATAYADKRAGAMPSGTVLVPDGTPGLSDAAAPSAPLPTGLYLTDTVVAAAGVDPSAPSTPGPERSLAGPDAVALSASWAAQSGLGIGDTLAATFPDGLPARLRVVAVLPDDAAPAEVVLARATVREHDPSALATAGAEPDATPSIGSNAALGARVVDVHAYARQADAEEDRLIWIFTLLLIGVSVGYGALAVANTLFMATARREPDYRLLRLAGATPRQVLLAVAGESALVVAIGAALGSAAAILALWGSVAGLREQTGAAVPLTVPWPTAAIAVGVCLALALAAAVLPARARLTRLDPARELS
ncbi:FtsX-like permease family protein [Actinoplanes sp. NPDC051513]|uniref:FtsX-like permease family protein n=1 Tax=Actinoplanes sp. NPDC051513 TaxID=3363908 RepID=UPI0037B37B24